jgi:hypothetical protein
MQEGKHWVLLLDVMEELRMRVQELTRDCQDMSGCLLVGEKIS